MPQNPARDKFRLVQFSPEDFTRERLEVATLYKGYNLKLREFIPYTQRRNEINDLVSWLSVKETKLPYETT